MPQCQIRPSLRETSLSKYRRGIKKTFRSDLSGTYLTAKKELIFVNNKWPIIGNCHNERGYTLKINEMTFDQLPAEVERLHERLAHIEELLAKRFDAQEEPESLMNVQEAAAFLNITVPTLYSKVSRKEVAAHKPGNRLYFSKTDLLTYIRSGKKPTNSDIREAAEAYVRGRKFR